MALPMPANTTCDIYRAGNAPPAAPDVQAACHLRPAYQEGLERGDSEAAKFRYTHVLSVDLAVDVRDDFDEFTGAAANRDTLYVPDKTGVGFRVNFVERVGRGWATDHKRVYLDRKLPTWPVPANRIVAGSGGANLGGRALVASYPVLIAASAGLQFGGQADCDFSPAAASSELFPGTITNVSGLWTNKDNMRADDGSNATSIISGTDTGNTDATNFGFALPGGATVDGIEVMIEAMEDSSALKLDFVKLLNTGEVGNNLGTSTELATSMTVYTFGSPTDVNTIWGTTPTAAEVNASGFGVRFKVTRTSGMGPTASIDYVKMKVHYH